MPKAKPLPSQERLKELLDYDPETGLFYWKVKPSVLVRAGSKAGYTRKDNYVAIKVDKQLFLAHRLAWKYVHGTDPVNVVDHKNGDPSDNRISNLQHVTQRQNTENNHLAKGVSWHSDKQKWYARIYVNGVQKFLGYFDCPLIARLAYLDAKDKYHPTHCLS